MNKEDVVQILQALVPIYASFEKDRSWLKLSKQQHRAAKKLLAPLDETNAPAELLVIKHMLNVHMALSMGWHITLHEYQTIGEMIKTLAESMKKQVEHSAETIFSDAVSKAIENL